MEYSILLGGFFIIALVYSSVGFGGGSSYLALLALSFFALPFPVIRSTSLFCNIIVVTGGTIIFYKQGKIDWKEIWPYFASSLPMSFLGGKLPLEKETFFVLLGFTLVVVAPLLWFQKKRSHPEGAKVIPEIIAIKLVLGSLIGLLSGLVGIGGGIFLSPILHMLRWSEPKRISALASVFILVNSVGGLAGQFQKGIPELSASFLLPLLLVVLVGGQIGSRLGAKTFNPLYIKRITAVLILIAGLNILKDHL